MPPETDKNFLPLKFKILEQKKIDAILQMCSVDLPFFLKGDDKPAVGQNDFEMAFDVIPNYQSDTVTKMISFLRFYDFVGTTDQIDDLVQSGILKIIEGSGTILWQ